MPDVDLHALTSLRRLRRAETDEARRDLGEALTQETALAAREAAMRRELDAARRAPGDFDREAFSAWFERMRIELAALAAATCLAEARTAVIRAALASRRVAETAAEDALAREVTARELTVERRDQAAWEDVARALKSARGPRRGNELV